MHLLNSASPDVHPLSTSQWEPDTWRDPTTGETWHWRADATGVLRTVYHSTKRPAAVFLTSPQPQAALDNPEAVP
jgi:hypothetical protein